MTDADVPAPTLPPLHLEFRHTFELRLASPEADAKKEPWTDLNVDSDLEDPRAALTAYLNGLFEPTQIEESRDGIFHIHDEMLPGVVIERYYRVRK